MRESPEIPTPVVIGSVLEDSAEATVRRIDALHPGCGLVEVRADRLTTTGIAEILGRVDRPVLVTIRRRDGGGQFDGSEEERSTLLEGALAAGARLVDVEWGTAPADLADENRADRVVLSHHGGPCTQDRLTELYHSMASSFGGRIKIVPDASRAGDAEAVRAVLRRSRDGTLACFAMGRAGVATRVLAPSWGSWATYGAAAPGRETAGGQLTAEDLLDLYEVLRIDAGTRRHALIGAHVSTSPSPAMHHAAYREGGVNACYLPIEIDDVAEIENQLGDRGGLELAALAVTIPFKEDAFRLSTPGDAVAAAAGAVNTVVIDDGGRWIGYNTDGPAAVASLAKHVAIAGARVAIVGAGGTARGIGAALAAAGASVTLFNRGAQRGRASAERLGVAAAPLGALQAAPWEILVQATPLGRDGETVLPGKRLEGRAVLDVVYGSSPTPLVREARGRGLHTVDGFDLLVAQAVLQYHRMTGAGAAAETMARAGRRWLGARSPAPA
jgi:3-dehydroquinate dehydratase/shikimate dehydrogenase